MSVVESVNFLFDIIVSRINFTKDNVEDLQSLVVNVKFNKVPINITQSRINVAEFQDGRQTQVNTEPNSLRIYLASNGLPITVRYRGSTLGTALLEFPQEFIDSIAVGMKDLRHSDEVSIVRKDEVVGNIEVTCMLTIKCDEPVGDFETRDCRNLGRNINPRDVMFVVGKQDLCPGPSGPCQDELEPADGDKQLESDLERYRSYNWRLTEPPMEAQQMQACSNLKNLTAEYEAIIDSLVRQVQQLPSPMPDEHFVYTDWSGRLPAPHLSPVDRQIRMPAEEIEEFGLKPIRYCPVCLTSMSWLPKYAACLKCQNKALPEMFPESQELLTADQIIADCLHSPTNYEIDEHPCKLAEEGMLEQVGQSPPAARCTCRRGKLCAHCRIRKLCADIFKRKGGSSELDCVKVEPASHQDFCVIVEDEEQCRPYLERVFTELRDLYEKRDARVEQAKRCTRASQGLPKAKSPPTSGIPLRPAGAPTLLHRSQPAKLGHKSCLKTAGVVSRRHGWSWPDTKMARKYGWRPGAICRYAGAIMKFFLQYCPDHSAHGICQRVQAEEMEKKREQPLLNICKRNGAIYITLRSVNSSSNEMKPITIKIVKSDLAKAMRLLKRKLKDMGFSKCRCHQSLMMCVCRHHLEKQQLERTLTKECQRLGMESCVDQLILTDTSESDMEYDMDVTPPLPAKNPLMAIKPRTLNMSTQTIKKEPPPVPTYPFPMSPYYRAYDCAAGDRYARTAFGKPGEQVYEDGIFGYGGSGPHGKPAPPGKEKSTVIWGTKSGGARFGKDFPGNIPKSGERVKSSQIPVRMPQRYYKEQAAKEKAKKDAIKAAKDKTKKGTDIIKYLEEKGAVAKPWDPNNPQPKRNKK